MTTWYVELNPAASEQLGHMLASLGELAGSEESCLEVDGVEHSCWIIPARLISKVRQSVQDYPDVFRKARFFKVDAPGRGARKADFLTRKRKSPEMKALLGKAHAFKARKGTDT